MAQGNIETGPDFDPAVPAAPVGIRIESLSSDRVRVQIRIPGSSRAVLSLPRIFSVLLAAVLVIQAWQHRVFVAFWFVGLPLLRWLRGPGPSSLAIAQEELVVSGARAFGGVLRFARSSIVRVEPGRAGVLQLLQGALLIRGKDGDTTPICVGLSPAQAEFLSQGLERWLENSA